MGLKQRRVAYANAVRSIVNNPDGPGSDLLRNALEEWLQVCADMTCAQSCQTVGQYVNSSYFCDRCCESSSIDGLPSGKVLQYCTQLGVVLP